MPEVGSKAPLEALSTDTVAAANFGSNSRGNECYEYIANNSFETDGDWFGQPATNVGFSDTYWYTGNRSLFLNSNFYSNAAIWQPLSIPQETDSIFLSLWSGIIFADPGETIFMSIYDSSLSELIYWDYLQYNTSDWSYFSTPLPVNLLAGRDVQFTLQVAQDYDAFYSEIVLDDVSLTLCSDSDFSPPTATPIPAATSTATVGAPTTTATATPTLLPSNTPTATPVSVNTPNPGTANGDLSIARIQVGQAVMAERDPITNAPITLIDEKPALVRVYVAQSGTESVENLDATLFVRDAQGTVQSYRSANGPIGLTGNSREDNAGTTINFVPNAASLKGSVDIWAQIDPDNLLPETNEANNTSAEKNYTFVPGKKFRIAWVNMNQGVDQNIAQNGDSDLRKFYPVGVNDVEYFFQPGFNQFINVPLNGQSYPEYLNALNRFWDRMTHEGSWVGGRPPDRLYGWAAGQHTGLCGVADALWVGGRGRVATGYALQCDAETFAHEIGHIIDAQGLRHSPNRPAEFDRNCAGQPVGPEPQFPSYPTGPLGTIGMNGFDVTKMQVLFPGMTYDFMSYCEPAWISPYNYNRIANGFGPVNSANAEVNLTENQDESAKLLVSGAVITGTISAEFDPFYIIRSSVAAEPSIGSDYCIELHDQNKAVLESRCFDLSFVDIERGLPVERAGFSLVVPYPLNAASVVLTHRGSQITSRSVSSNQPFVRLTSPIGGESLAGSDSFTVKWNGADLDEDTLFYSLSYSIDNGDSWLPLATDITETSYAVDLSLLPGSSQVKFRVSASDGINTAYDSSDGLEIGFVGDTSISVSGKPPTAAIRTEAQTLEPSQPVILAGTGYDLEDGLLPENGLEWWSNRDGALGTGSWLQTSLSNGEHVISLKVTDSNGNVQTSTVNITVQDETGVVTPEPDTTELFLPVISQ